MYSKISKQYTHHSLPGRVGKNTERVEQLEIMVWCGLNWWLKIVLYFEQEPWNYGISCAQQWNRDYEHVVCERARTWLPVAVVDVFRVM